MKRVMSDGTAEDLIRSFVQFGCTEGHIKTLIEKYNAQLESGLVEDVECVSNKLLDLTEELNLVAEIRRGVMRKLFDMYDSDTDFWCVVKHLGVGVYNLFEAYQASDDDVELFNLYLQANKRFVKAMTYFLGAEIGECAACLFEHLRAEGKNKEKEKK